MSKRVRILSKKSVSANPAKPTRNAPQQSTFVWAARANIETFRPCWQSGHTCLALPLAGAMPLLRLSIDFKLTVEKILLCQLTPINTPKRSRLVKRHWRLIDMP